MSVQVLEGQVLEGQVLEVQWASVGSEAMAMAVVQVPSCCIGTGLETHLRPG